MNEDFYTAAAQKITNLMPRIGRLMHSIGESGKGSKERNIPPVQFFVMRRLSENGPLSMGEIAKLIRTSKPNLTMLVDRMEKAALVRRVPDKSDRRIIKVSLTKKAMNQIDEISRSRTESALEKLSSLGEEDIIKLNKAMDEMMDVLGKL